LDHHHLHSFPTRRSSDLFPGSSVVIQPWALTASAVNLDAAARAEVAREFEEWLAAGGRGMALVTCHRAELYGFGAMPALRALPRSEEHTSELQSRGHLVC